MNGGMGGGDVKSFLILSAIDTFSSLSKILIPRSPASFLSLFFGIPCTNRGTAVFFFSRKKDIRRSSMEKRRDGKRKEGTQMKSLPSFLSSFLPSSAAAVA